MTYRPVSIILFAVAGICHLSTSLLAKPTLESNEVTLQTDGPHAIPRGDFLLDPSPFTAEVRYDEASHRLTLENGLIRRTWLLSPSGVCIAFDNVMTGESMLRSVRPEARLVLNGTSFPVGGLQGQPNHAYLAEEWLQQMQVDQNAFQLQHVEVGRPTPRLAWGRRRHASPLAKWPPAGISLRFDYAPPTGTASSESVPSDVRVSVHYEIYDGIPAMSKWLTIENKSDEEVTVDRFTVEELAVVERQNWVEFREGVDVPPPDCLHVETDFAFGGFNFPNSNRHVVHWRTDPLYTTQVNYALQTPCLLVVEPTYGPAQRIAASASWESCRVFEMAYDRGNRERRGLALRRLYRTIAPWVTENPITHHLLSSDATRVRQAIDQAAEVGFEAVILSFGSGFNMENQDPDFLAEWTEVARYAESKGVEIGSYSLFSSRGVGAEHMIVPPEGVKCTHGKCPAVTSQWGQEWLRTIEAFYRDSGFDQFENDGPYPGDIDVTPRPPLQQGEQDSRWVQWRMTVRLYQQLRAMGVYINAPDAYYLSGSNKCGMGYREVNWSLPRAQQVIHTRQNIFDGTWTKTPSMGWMFVPLAQYHGGGEAATVEPLSEHLDHYRTMMQSNFAMGVQAHYRGPRIYDTPETREMVREQVVWFKKYRDILESDIIHGRRADGRDLDWVLHVNPELPIKGMLCIFNPLPSKVSRTIHPNLYYTGLDEVVSVSHEGEPAIGLELSRRGEIPIKVELEAGEMTWYLFR